MTTKFTKVWLICIGSSLVVNAEEHHWVWFSILAALGVAEVLWGATKKGNNEVNINL